MNAATQLNRFAGVDAIDPLYCLHKPDGSFSLLTAADHHEFAADKLDAVTYCNSDRVIEPEDFLPHDVTRSTLDLFDQGLLAKKRVFTLFPFTLHGPLIESEASPTDLGAYFFQLLTRCKDEERAYLKLCPSLTTIISSILKMRAPGVQLAQKALSIIESLKKEDIPRTIEEDESGSSGTLTDQEPVRKESERYTCPISGCTRNYRQKGDLKFHVKDKHADDPSYKRILAIISPPRSRKEGKPFPCPDETCPSGYKCRKDLHHHLQKKHGDM